MATSQIHDQHLTEPAHESHVRSYVIVFAALMVLLVLTIGAAFVDFHHPAINFLIAGTIAIIKGALIIMFFMHVKTGPRRVVIFAVGGFLWLGMMVVFFLADYGTRNDLSYPNPKGEPRYVHYNGTPVEQPGSANAGSTSFGQHGPALSPKAPSLERNATP